MLDHVGFDVSDYERSRAFYERALAPLGLKLLMEPVPGVGGFGDGQKSSWPQRHSETLASDASASSAASTNRARMPST